MIGNAGKLFKGFDHNPSRQKKAKKGMFDWQLVLKESPIDWLLEATNPSVRYFTLRDILGRDESDSQVVAAKRAIRDSPIVQTILRNQKPEGYWEQPMNPYLPKYKASYWQLMILGLLGVDRSEPRVEKACEYIFRFQHEEGGFSYETEETAAKKYDGHLKKGRNLPPFEDWLPSRLHEGQVSCLTGNMVAALNRLGYGDDPRVQRAAQWLVKVQNVDGGWLCPYWKAHIRDRHSCFYGSICALEAFSETRLEDATGEMRQTIERAAEFLLMHRLFKADHHGYAVINRFWLRLGFPWFAGYNVLRGLDVLTRLGYVADERLSDAVEVLLQKRLKDGTWSLESTPTGRMHTNIEARGKPSKWITLIALRTLKRLSSNPAVAKTWYGQA